MNLIPNWRKAWRMFSVQSMAIATALLGSWAALPEDLKSHIPDKYVLWTAVALLVAGVIGRLIDQPSVKE